MTTLDEGVIPLVEYFNSVGLTTEMSCEGHSQPSMSMFWISFTPDITQEDITNWMEYHLNEWGHFTSCGRFVQRFYIVDGGRLVTSYQYLAANKSAAATDLLKWKEEAKFEEALIAECLQDGMKLKHIHEWMKEI